MARILIGWKLMSAQGTKLIGFVKGLGVDLTKSENGWNQNKVVSGAHLLSRKMDETKTKLCPADSYLVWKWTKQKQKWWRRISSVQESADERMEARVLIEAEEQTQVVRREAMRHENVIKKEMRRASAGGI